MKTPPLSRAISILLVLAASATAAEQGPSKIEIQRAAWAAVPAGGAKAAKGRAGR